MTMLSLPNQLPLLISFFSALHTSWRQGYTEEFSMFFNIKADLRLIRESLEMSEKKEVSLVYC